MGSKRCSTDLSDAEWECLRAHLPASSKRGRPRLHGLRAILDAVFYVLKSGCPWRLLPKDFPPWKTVYDWFRRWRIDGTWERLNAELRELLRVRLGRDPDPSAGIVDSQRTRTTGVGGTERGFDPAKKVEGRKRHLLVDTEGLVLKAKVHTAPKFQTKMESGYCLTRRAIALGGFRTYGSTRATSGGVEDGPRRCWV